MPRYFFHLCDGTQEIDAYGNDFDDDAAALREAIRFGGELLSDDPGILVRDDSLRINVTNESGELSCALIVQIVDANWRPAPASRDDLRVPVSPTRP